LADQGAEVRIISPDASRPVEDGDCIVGKAPDLYGRFYEMRPPGNWPRSSDCRYRENKTGYDQEWSQGKNQKYPYYLCPTKGCASYRKSIKREELESAFEGIL